MGWQSRLKENIEGLKKKLTSFSGDGHLGSLKFFNVTNNVAMTLVGVSLNLYMRFSIEYIPIRRIAGSKVTYIFNFTRYYHIALYSA